MEIVYDKELKIIDFPIYFFLEFPFATPGPITCTVQALLDEVILEIVPMEIDLGKCLTSETVLKKLTLTNKSIVPQHIGFTEMPEVRLYRNIHVANIS
jgi:hypothetical protein